jgi:adenine/guanine phosphoribosyltransferase-like PRPP-binding protein
MAQRAPLICWATAVVYNPADGSVTFAIDVSIKPEVVERILARAVGDLVRANPIPGTNRWVAVPKARLAPDDVESAIAALSALTIIRASGDDVPVLAMALGWHTVFGSGGNRTELGELEYRAKWAGDAVATTTVCERFVDLLRKHKMLSRSKTVVACPSEHQLAIRLAAAAATVLGGSLVVASKIDPQKRQFQQDDVATSVEEALAGPRGNIILPDQPVLDPVLIVDDLYSSGGTIAEVTRCLRAKGINRIYSLTVTKTATSHRRR